MPKTLLARFFCCSRHRHSDSDDEQLTMVKKPSEARRSTTPQEIKAIVALDFDGTISTVATLIEDLQVLTLESKEIVRNIRSNINRAFTNNLRGEAIVTGSFHEDQDVYAFWCTERTKNRLLKLSDTMLSLEFYSILFQENPCQLTDPIVFIKNIPQLKIYFSALTKNQILCIPATNRLLYAMDPVNDSDIVPMQVTLAAMNLAFGEDRDFFTLAQSNAMSDMYGRGSKLPRAHGDDSKVVLLQIAQKTFGDLPSTSLHLIDDTTKHIEAAKSHAYNTFQVTEDGLLDCLHNLAQQLLPEDALEEINRELAALNVTPPTVGGSI